MSSRRYDERTEAKQVELENGLLSVGNPWIMSKSQHHLEDLDHLVFGFHGLTALLHVIFNLD